MKPWYRFLQTRAGKIYFARVQLEVQPGETAEVVDVLPEQVDANGGEVNRQTAPTWVAAALDGIRATLAHSRQVEPLAPGCRILLSKLVGTPADTREDVVRCAAGLAAWEALGTSSPTPEAEFDGHQWHLVFPARIPSAVQGTAR